MLRAPWPGLCAVCGDWGRGRVCTACDERFAPIVPRCRRCALPVPAGVVACGACLVHPPPFDAGVAAADYAYPWDRLVAAFKFRDALELGSVFATAIAAAHRAAGAARPDLIVPVPLGAARLRERGYNQAWELARRIARGLAAPAAPADARLLLRTRDTPHQLALPPAEREANVRGAFAVEPLRRDAVVGRALLVVDDVMTTGSTLAEVARTLRAAGAASVTVAVFARTPAPADA